MNILLLIYAITLGSLLANMGLRGDDKPPVDRLSINTSTKTPMSAIEMDQHNVTEVDKDQGIGGAEHGVGGAGVTANITAADGIHKYGFNNTLPDIVGGENASTVSPPNNQDVDQDKVLRKYGDDKPPVERLSTNTSTTPMSAIEVDQHNVTEVDKDQGISGVEHGVGGAGVTANITAADGIHKYGFNNTLPDIVGGENASTASPQNNQDVDQDKDMIDGQKTKKPKCGSNNRKSDVEKITPVKPGKGGNGKGKGDCSRRGEKGAKRPTGHVTPDLNGHHSANETGNSSVPRDVNRAQTTTEKPGPDKKLEDKTVLIVVLYLMFAAVVVVLVRKHCMSNYCRRRFNRTRFYDDESIYPL